MSLKDLCEEFIAAGQGELHLGGPGNGCMMPDVEGPDGKRGWQLLIFWGGHGSSNKRFVVNPFDKLGYPLLSLYILADRVKIYTDPIPPMGDLNDGARAAARAVLEALANK